MKRYTIPVNTIWPQCVNGKSQVYLADETDETIMNMVEEFAETAKEYEEEIAKKDKLYNELYAITSEEMDKLAAKIARLRKALEFYADKKGYYGIDEEPAPIQSDNGDIAREALGKEE